MLVFYDGDEEKIIDALKIVLNTGREKLTVQKLDMQSEIHCGDIQINLDKRTVFRKQQEIELTYTEFEILQLLAQCPGRVFSREQIYDLVWKEPYSGDYNIVMSHIRHIREKIEDNPSKPIYIQTVWGVGYKFNERLSSDSS